MPLAVSMLKFGDLTMKKEIGNLLHYVILSFTFTLPCCAYTTVFMSPLLQLAHLLCNICITIITGTFADHLICHWRLLNLHYC